MYLFEDDIEPIKQVRTFVKQQFPKILTFNQNNPNNTWLELEKGSPLKDGSALVNVEIRPVYIQRNPYKNAKTTKDIASMHPDPKIQQMLRDKINAKDAEKDSVRAAKIKEWDDKNAAKVAAETKFRKQVMQKIAAELKKSGKVKKVGVPGLGNAVYNYVSIDDIDWDKFKWYEDFIRFKFVFTPGTYPEKLDITKEKRKIYAFLKDEIKNNLKLKKAFKFAPYQTGKLIIANPPPHPIDDVEVSNELYKRDIEEYRRQLKEQNQMLLDLFNKNKAEYKKFIDDLIARVSKITPAIVSFTFETNKNRYEGIGTFDIERPPK